MSKAIIGTCGKCNGVGSLRAYSHIANGMCFWCAGTGKCEVKAEKPAVATRKPKIVDLPSINAKAQLSKGSGDVLTVLVYEGNDELGSAYMSLSAARRGRIELWGMTCDVKTYVQEITNDLQNALKPA